MRAGRACGLWVAGGAAAQTWRHLIPGGPGARETDGGPGQPDAHTPRQGELKSTWVRTRSNRGSGPTFGPAHSPRLQQQQHVRCISRTELGRCLCPNRQKLTPLLPPSRIDIGFCLTLPQLNTCAGACCIAVDGDAMGW
jgi:hypothetical protein